MEVDEFVYLQEKGLQFDEKGGLTYAAPWHVANFSGKRNVEEEYRTTEFLDEDGLSIKEDEYELLLGGKRFEDMTWEELADTIDAPGRVRRVDIRSFPPSVYIASKDGHYDQITIKPQIHGEEGYEPRPRILQGLNAGVEAHLEEFLIRNWSKTSFGREFDILKSESGQLIGRQYQTDVGPIDILAISKDRKTYLVVELKRGTSSDRTIGQVLRYIGYVSAEEAENDQDVRGVIVGTAENKKLQRAISVVDKVTFVKYSLHFQLDGDSFGDI